MNEREALAEIRREIGAAIDSLDQPGVCVFVRFGIYTSRRTGAMKMWTCIRGETTWFDLDGFEDIYPAIKGLAMYVFEYHVAKGEHVSVYAGGGGAKRNRLMADEFRSALDMVRAWWKRESDKPVVAMLEQMTMARRDRRRDRGPVARACCSTPTQGK
ncbi:hypothetical protein [Paraburkholderia atlantica]|uniref:hypothetical protein n=1 Tax=Paraburkholderia atlantica TaxID=2654982 RepID=UPI003D1C6ADD